MNQKTKFANIFLAVFVLGMSLMLCPSSTVAFSLKSADVDQIVHSEPNYKINSLFVEIHPIKGYVVVGEIVMYLMDFKVGEKHYRTTFINKRGDTSYADSVEAFRWEGKRVLLKGYRLGNGKIIAESIKRVERRRK